ncbi:ASPIC/UnbV domain-containing protein [bacterium]|nr:ASPIC/UnbV domain-containing protein [bacterium]
MNRTKVLAHKESDAKATVGNVSFAGGACVHSASMLALSFSGHEEKPLFHNKGGGKFIEIGGAMGVGVPLDGRGLAAGDLFQRGAVDLLLGTAYKPPLLAFVNEVGTRKGMLTLRLRSPCGKNRFAIGARVLFEGDGRKQLQELGCGESFLSCNPAELYFGLGDAENAKKLTITWPSGKVTALADVPAGIVTVMEGEGGFRHEDYRKVAIPQTKPVRPLRQGDEVGFTLTSGAGHRLPASSWKDRVSLLLIWSARCTSCVTELKAVPDLVAATEKHGVRLVTVNVDEDSTRATELARTLEKPIHLWRIADPDVLLNPHEPLVPAVFLVGKDGKVIARHTGTLTPAELESFLDHAGK